MSLWIKASAKCINVNVCVHVCVLVSLRAFIVCVSASVGVCLCVGV